MSALDEWVQDALFDHAAFEPCSMEQPCGNCDHPMRSHFLETEKWYATGCGICACHYWLCRHIGHVCLPGAWL